MNKMNIPKTQSWNKVLWKYEQFSVHLSRFSITKLRINNKERKKGPSMASKMYLYWGFKLWHNYICSFIAERNIKWFTRLKWNENLYLIIIWFIILNCSVLSYLVNVCVCLVNGNNKNNYLFKYQDISRKANLFMSSSSKLSIINRHLFLFSFSSLYRFSYLFFC